MAADFVLYPPPIHQPSILHLRNDSDILPPESVVAESSHLSDAMPAKRPLPTPDDSLAPSRHPVVNDGEVDGQGHKRRKNDEANQTQPSASQLRHPISGGPPGSSAANAIVIDDNDADKA